MRRDQPGSFPFRLERQPLPRDTSQDIEDASRLRIDFIYRTLESDLHAVLSPHLSKILSKHNIQPSRRIVEAISCQLIADTKLTQRFNKLHVIDSLGQADIVFDEGDLWPEWRDFREALRSYWTSDDEWDRIRAAILEACQVRCHSPATMLLSFVLIFLSCSYLDAHFYKSARQRALADGIDSI